MSQPLISFPPTVAIWSHSGTFIGFRIPGQWHTVTKIICPNSHAAGGWLSATGEMILRGYSVGTVSKLGEWELFTCAMESGGICLRTAHNRFVSSDQSGSVAAHKETPGHWEVLRVHRAPTGAILFQMAGGGFLTARGGLLGGVHGSGTYTDAGAHWTVYDGMEAKRLFYGSGAPLPPGVVGITGGSSKGINLNAAGAATAAASVLTATGQAITAGFVGGIGWGVARATSRNVDRMVPSGAAGVAATAAVAVGTAAAVGAISAKR